MILPDTCRVKCRGRVWQPCFPWFFPTNVANDVGKSGYLGKHRREFRHLARLVASIDHWIIVKALPCIFLNVNWLEVRERVMGNG